MTLISGPHLTTRDLSLTKIGAYSGYLGQIEGSGLE